MSTLLDKLVRDFNFTVEDQASFLLPSPLGLVPVVTSLVVIGDSAADVSLYCGGTRASLNVDCTNANSDVTFRSLRGGDSGEGINIAYLDPSANDEPLSVAVTVNATPATGGYDIDIDITLSTNGSGTIIATGQDIIDLINGTAATRIYVEAYKSASNDGTGVVEAKVAAPLATGVPTLKFRDTQSAAFSKSYQWAPGGAKGDFGGDDVKAVISTIAAASEINCSGFWVPAELQSSPLANSLTGPELMAFA